MKTNLISKLTSVLLMGTLVGESYGISLGLISTFEELKNRLIEQTNSNISDLLYFYIDKNSNNVAIQVHCSDNKFDKSHDKYANHEDYMLLYSLKDDDYIKTLKRFTLNKTPLFESTKVKQISHLNTIVHKYNPTMIDITDKLNDYESHYNLDNMTIFDEVTNKEVKNENKFN